MRAQNRLILAQIRCIALQILDRRLDGVDVLGR